MTRTNNIEVESNGEDVWISISGKEKMKLTIEEFDDLLDAMFRLNPKLAEHFNN